MLELYFFNVGHGDSIAVKFPNGDWGIIDCYRNLEDTYPPVFDFLNKQGVTKLNFICITHPHSDHIKGIDILANNFDIDKFYLFGVKTGSPCEKTNDKPLIKALLAVTKNAKEIEKIEVVSANENKAIGNIVLKILSPDEKIRDQLRLTTYVNESQDFNKESIVIFFQYASKNVLLTSDITPNFWNDIYEHFNRKIDLIKISHHGSGYSNKYNDLSKYINKDAVAIISTDGGRRFPSVPDLQFIEILKKDLNCNVLCTSDLNTSEEYLSEDNNLLTNDIIDLMSEKINEPKYSGYIKCIIHEDGNISTELINK